MARHYASVDLGLALSGWETFGLSILESMACGNAQIGASTGAAAEHIRESGAGVVLKERTPQALADAIVELYVLSPLIKSPYKTYFLNIPYFMRVRKRLDAEKIRKIG